MWRTISNLVLSKRLHLIFRRRIHHKHFKNMPGTTESFVDIKLPCSHDPFKHGMEEVIDVRTPAEYVQDHIPGSINLPVLTNEQRHEIGKQYAENSFEARRCGAALISANINQIINNHFIDKPRDYSCLVYCWRGGQRSRSLALVLSMIGYHVKFLVGGYKNYRKHVTANLLNWPAKYSYNVIGGMTGCGKTLLLQELRNSGEQVLDLEKLAKHKGSVLGINSSDCDQPTSRMFESLLLQKLKEFDPSLPVWVEAEGRRIGNVQIPNCVFQLIIEKVSNFYVIQSTVEARVNYLLTEYKYWTTNPEELKNTLTKLTKFNPPLKKWFKLIDENKFREFVTDILKFHYDPSYKKSQGKSFVNEKNQAKKISVDVEAIDSVNMNMLIEKLSNGQKAQSKAAQH